MRTYVGFGETEEISEHDQCENSLVGELWARYLDSSLFNSASLLYSQTILITIITMEDIYILDGGLEAFCST